MKLEPYERVDDTPFSASAADIVRARGQPWRSRRNEIGLDELDYGDVVYRFQDCGRLEEVTLQAPVVTVGKVAVPFASLGSFLGEHDPGLFELAGFLVSPSFGLAFDPGEPCWVTALARHCIGQWEALRSWQRPSDRRLS